jgi:hypothetical protein
MRQVKKETTQILNMETQMKNLMMSLSRQTIANPQVIVLRKARILMLVKRHYMTSTAQIKQRILKRKVSLCLYIHIHV